MLPFHSRNLFQSKQKQKINKSTTTTANTTTTFYYAALTGNAPARSPPCAVSKCTRHKRTCNVCWAHQLSSCVRRRWCVFWHRSVFSWRQGCNIYSIYQLDVPPVDSDDCENGFPNGRKMIVILDWWWTLQCHDVLWM